MTSLTLISHMLCPYAQRISISLTEKKLRFTRIDIDLANKPDWFLEISPLGKVPVLQVEQEGQSHVIFESAVILQYLEEVSDHPMLSGNPLIRAQERSWIEFASSLLNDIAGFYSASSEKALEEKRVQLSRKFALVETDLMTASWFSDQNFGLLEAVFAPVFRYFDVFDHISDFEILTPLKRTGDWRERLASQPSVQQAVSIEYPSLLTVFLKRKESALSRMMV